MVVLQYLAQCCVLHRDLAEEEVDVAAIVDSMEEPGLWARDTHTERERIKLVLQVFGRCLGGVYVVSGWCLGGVWAVFGWCLGGVWGVL